MPPKTEEPGAVIKRLGKRRAVLKAKITNQLAILQEENADISVSVRIIENLLE